MQISSTRKNIAMVVFTIGDTIHFTPLDKYNPNVMDAKAPVFDGTFDDCVTFISEVL